MKRIVSFVLCLVIVLASIFPVFASSDFDVSPWLVDVTIDQVDTIIDATENSLNSILGYNGAVTTALNDVIKLVLYGSDMYPALEAAAEDAGYDGDVTAYLLHQLTYYTSNQYIVDVSRDMFLDQVHLLQDGSLVLGDEITSWIGDFVDWIWDDVSGPGLSDYADTIPGNSLYYMDGYLVNYVPFGQSVAFDNTIYAATGFVFGYKPKDDDDDENKFDFGFRYTISSGYGGGLVFVTYNDKLYWGGVNTSASSGGSYLYNYSANVLGVYSLGWERNSWSSGMSFPLWDPSLYTSWNVYAPVVDRLPTFGPLIEEPGVAQPVGDPDWINPGYMWMIKDRTLYTPTVDVSGPGVVLPIDFLHGVSDSLDGKPSIVPVYDDTTGEPIGTVTLTPTGVDLPGEVVTSVPDNAIANPFENIADGDGLSDFRLDIQFRDLFPFCIPFDVYDLLDKFTAEPEAPNFDFPIKSEIGGIDETIEFDLSAFDSVAAVLRKLELVAFAVGLAFVTKQLLS